MASGSSTSSPLDSQNYFSSPLGTILESVNDPQSEIITLHDLTEAYASLSRRIRLQASAILSNERVYPAFDPFQAESHSLTICLCRDIGRCLLNPLSIFSQAESVSDDSLLIEEGAERGQAYATLSHHALVFLSDIFSFVPLTHTLSTDQLSELIREVLLILSTPSLPTPSSEKTWKLAIWILVSQRLQLDIWLPHKQILKKVLLRLVQGTFDGHSFKVDGFKFLSTLLRFAPSEFLQYLLHLFPQTLWLSLEDIFDLKLSSLEILRSAVALKLDTPNVPWSQKLALETVAFIKMQHRSSQGGPLHSLLNSAMNNSGEIQWDNKGPLWALLFTACLICISDTHLFTHPHSLKLIMPILAQAADHKRTYVRALHPHVWNCLIWCYTRLPADGGKDPHTGQDMTTVRKNAFRLVKQELRGGIATVLVASILSKSSFTITKRDITQVLKLIKETLGSQKESQIREGTKIFCRLLSTVGTPSRARDEVRNFSEIVIRELFVGSFLDLPESQIRVLSARLPGPDERFVQPLTEDQIRENWKELVELWIYTVDCTRLPGVRFKQYEDQLIIIWQSLLLVQSHLTSDSDTTLLSLSPATSNHVTSIVTSFVKLDNDGSAVTAEDQLQGLRFVHRLWSPIKHSFAAVFLASTAETLLVAILLKVFNFIDKSVKDAWGALCVDLVSVIGKPEVLVQSVFTRIGEQQGVERVAIQTQRQLWVVIASNDLFRAKGQEWEDILSFLSVPIRLWSMDPHEENVWKKLFAFALEITNASSGTPHDALNALLRKLGGDTPRLKACSALLPLLLPHLHFNPSNLLHLDFLSIINELLVKMYPPKPEDLVAVLPILEGIAKVIGGCGAEVIVKFLLILKDGLTLWIRDEAKILLESEHTAVVRSIYCSSLSILSTLPPSLYTLQALSALLSSSFDRMGYPPIGPLAFEQYWRKGGFHNQDSDNFKKLIPEELKACLKAWSDHCGDSLAEGCTSTMDSQSTTRSFALDSQSPDKGLVPEYEFAKIMDLDDAGIDSIVPDSDPAPVLLSDDTFETPRGSTPRPSLQYHRGETSPVFRDLETATAQKRFNSQASSRPNKRRRTDSVETASPVPLTKQPQSMNSKSFSSHHSSDQIDQSIQPLVAGRQTDPSRQRRIIVSTPPPDDDFVPETSSPTGPVTPPSPDHLIDASTLDSRYIKMDPPHYSSDIAHQKIGHHVSNQPGPSKRLQSEPVIDSYLPSRPTPLRRNHTTSERLGALERAYSLLVDSQGVSQVPLEELAHAAQITHKIGAKIAEQMSKKLPERV